MTALRTRWHCTGCQSILAKLLPRGTIRVEGARVESVYALANGHHLLVCHCGRRNLLKGIDAKMLTTAPLEPALSAG